MGLLLSSTLVGLMVTSSKRAYATSRTAAPRAPVAGHCWPHLHRRHSNTEAGLAQSLWGLLVHTDFVWCLWVCLGGLGFGSKCDFTISDILFGLLLCPWTWGIFFWWDLTFSCWWQFSSSCSFGVLTEEDEHVSLYSAILIRNQHPKKVSFSSQGTGMQK